MTVHPFPPAPRPSAPAHETCAGEYEALALFKAWQAYSETTLRRIMALSDMQDKQIEWLIDAISDNSPGVVSWEEKIQMARNSR